MRKLTDEEMRLLARYQHLTFVGEVRPLTVGETKDVERIGNLLLDMSISAEVEARQESARRRDQQEADRRTAAFLDSDGGLASDE